MPVICVLIVSLIAIGVKIQAPVFNALQALFCLKICAFLSVILITIPRNKPASLVIRLLIAPPAVSKHQIVQVVSQTTIYSKTPALLRFRNLYTPWGDFLTLIIFL
jgi:hypothetical protein